MTVNVYATRLDSASVARVYRTQFATSAGSVARVYATSLATAASYPRVYRTVLATTGTAAAPIVDPIPARTVDGWDPVTITPTANQTPDQWIYTVLAGNVALTGSGTSRTFTAPPLFKGTTVRVSVQASKAGVISQPQVGVYTVKPWNSFILVGTSLTTDVVDGNAPALAVAFDVVDGGTASTDVLNGGTASLPADVVDGRTSTGASTGTLEAIDGGAGSAPADTVDGGTDTGTGTAWMPRRPIQLI